MKIVGHRHTAIIVRDLDLMVSFYVSLGFVQTRRDLEQGDFISHLVALKDAVMETVKLSLGNGYVIELIKYISHAPLGLPESFSNEGRQYYFGYDHIGFTVDDLDTVITHIISNGGAMISSPKHTNPGLPSIHAYVSDPENNLIHLAQNA